MKKPLAIALSLIFSLALCACASNLPAAKQPVEVPPPKATPAPVDVMQARSANFRQRLLDFLSTSPPKPTTSSTNSPQHKP